MTDQQQQQQQQPTQTNSNIGIDSNLPEIHFSDATEFLKCRRSWNWASRLRGNLEPVRPYAPFVLGRAVHEAAEKLQATGAAPLESLTQFFAEERALRAAAREAAEAAPKPPPRPLAGASSPGVVDEEPFITVESPEAVDEQVFREQEELSIGIMEHYARWEKRQKGPFSLNNLEFVTLEQEFLVPIIHPSSGAVANWAVFGGKWDGLVRRKDTGGVYIWELKTTKSILHRARMLANDMQCTWYMNAARLAFPELAGDIQGMVYTLMKKAVPKPLTVLKDGMLSKSVTGQSFESYLMWAERHHADERARLEDVEWRKFVMHHYAAPLTALSQPTAADNIFFERHVATRTPQALASGALDLWNLSRVMTDRRLPLYPTPNFHCGYCLFRAPCIEVQNHGEATVTLATEYRLRQQHAGDSDADTE